MKDGAFELGSGELGTLLMWILGFIGGVAAEAEDSADEEVDAR